MTLHGRDAGSFKLKMLSSKARYVFDATALYVMIFDLIYFLAISLNSTFVHFYFSGWFCRWLVQIKVEWSLWWRAFVVLFHSPRYQRLVIYSPHKSITYSSTSSVIWIKHIHIVKEKWEEREQPVSQIETQFRVARFIRIVILILITRSILKRFNLLTNKQTSGIFYTITLSLCNS